MTIEVTTDRPTYRPGDTVSARVRVTSSKDMDDAVVELSLERIVEVPGNGACDRAAVAGRYLLDGETLAAGEREWTVELPVPRRTTPPAEPDDCADERYPPSGDAAAEGSYDAWIEPQERWGPPTSLGRGVHVRWAVRCEVGEGKDRQQQEQPVVVLAPPLAVAPPPARHRGEGEPACTITFSGLPAGSVRVGSSVGGRLRLVAHQEIDARGVRVDLVRVARSDPADDVLTWDVIATATASDALGLRPRQPRDFAFSLVVPADASPSVDTEGYVVEYLLRAVIDRPRRSDTVWDHVIAVHNSD
ncbi:hypothetical protein ACFQE5_03605 [Pseudonocardia hispaniensis]|uniref:Arrestin-like N-terminal domain-containing protein n=1 Tax=Pseudonocardia hispaniensis TaxID=904933 RepID=A0ABW1IXV2_9PSEU